MGTEQFCLRWNDYHANITSAFSNIRDDDDFLDVTLVCDGNTVQAHKLVLSACSPLFRVMLKKNSHPQPMIFLRGIRYPDMVAILNFMYRGEVNVNQEDLQMFLAAAEELRIKGLSQASNDSKMEKLENVPKKKQVSGGALPGSLPAQPPVGQPPNKKLRESSPGISPVSTPASAKSPLGPEDDETEPPQLSVKREFKSREQGRQENNGDETDEDSQQNNLLDCLVQAQQNFAFQQGAGQGASPGFEQNNLNNYNSPQHIMSGGGSANPMSSSQGDKGLLQFLGQNSANVSSAAANAIMMQRLLGTGYELHPLGSRKDNDPMAHIKVARSSKGWHCPQCIHISSTKGNLKSHILSGRHKTYTEKPFGCQYCDRSYGTKQSLQVHISTNHRAERDAEYQALSKSLGMKSFPDPSFYIKSENNSYESQAALQSLVHNTQNISPAALQQLQHLQGNPPTSNTASPTKTISNLSILKADSHLAHQMNQHSRNGEIEDLPVGQSPGQSVSQPPVRLEHERVQQAAVAAVQRQNLHNITSLASCRMESQGDMVGVLKNMDIQKLNNIQAPQHLQYEEDMLEDDGGPLSPKGETRYAAPSLHADSSNSSSSSPLALANVEASMDTSITTP